MMDRWSLPGPAAFLRQALDALADWSNLVIACPCVDVVEVHDGLERALRHWGREWRVGGPLPATTAHPIDVLADALDLRREGDALLTPAALVERLRDYDIVLVQGLDAGNWHAWRTFLVEYEQAVRGVSAFQRTVLVAVVGGVPKEQMCKRAPALRTLAWDGVVGELDVLTYVAMSRRRRGAAVDRRERLISRMVCRLAAGDLSLAEALIGLEDRQLFDATAAVRQTGITRRQQGQPNRWEMGELATVDGEPVVHSAVLARDGDGEGVLSMRLWAAQAAEILPALEINRRWLAQRMRASGLRMPVQLGDQIVDDVDNLEIGQLAFLARQKRLSSDIQRLASKWRHVRNKLAHLEPLSADEALDQELLALPPSLAARASP